MMGVDFSKLWKYHKPTQKRFHFICIFTDDGIILRCIDARFSLPDLKSLWNSGLKIDHLESLMHKQNCRSDSTLFFQLYRKLHCAKSARQSSTLPSFKVIIIIGFWFAFEKTWSAEEQKKLQQQLKPNVRKNALHLGKRYILKANALKPCVQTIVYLVVKKGKGCIPPRYGH